MVLLDDSGSLFFVTWCCILEFFFGVEMVFDAYRLRSRLAESRSVGCGSGGVVVVLYSWVLSLSWDGSGCNILLPLLLFPSITGEDEC